MQIELTPDQAKKLETIKWLTDPFGARGTGRTQLLAIAYAQHSLNYRTWVSIVNHGNSYPRADDELLERIMGIVHGMGGYTLKVRGRQGGKPSILVEPIPKQEEIIKEYKSFDF